MNMNNFCLYIYNLINKKNQNIHIERSIIEKKNIVHSLLPYINICCVIYYYFLIKNILSESQTLINKSSSF